MTDRLMRFRHLLAALVAVIATLPAIAAAPVEADSVAAGTAAAADSVAARHRRQAVTVTPEAGRGVRVVNIEGDTLLLDMSADSIAKLEGYVILSDSVTTPAAKPVKVFNPDPKRAMWLSILCPGLGQIYNRRYWKLPIIVGGFVGLAYGTTWNNRMLQDYRRGYRDIMDDDPDTRSYMNFFAPTVKEENLDPEWIKNAMRNKRDYYRRYRDICIIGMVAVYLLNVIDAYVDASLAHFDISPDLSLDVRPAAIGNDRRAIVADSRLPSVGLQCALTF